MVNSFVALKLNGRQTLSTQTSTPTYLKTDICSSIVVARRPATWPEAAHLSIAAGSSGLLPTGEKKKVVKCVIHLERTRTGPAACLEGVRGPSAPSHSRPTSNGRLPSSTRAQGCLIFDARFPMPSWHLHTTKERRPQLAAQLRTVDMRVAHYMSLRQHPTYCVSLSPTS